TTTSSGPDDPAPREATGTYTYDSCPGVFPGSEQQCVTHKVVTEVEVERVAATAATGATGARNVTVKAAADVKRTFGIFVRVVTTPQQRARVRWKIACGRSNGAAFFTSDGGRYTTTSTKRRYLPIKVDSPDECSPRVTATTARGRLQLRIYAEVPGKIISDTVTPSG
ncbi:MAG: hypothetical protein H0W96_16730, partial [Solirubrobacterales bacterium]|nr:hypothetical protein [Solirubrobacterales bacterium]